MIRLHRFFVPLFLAGLSASVHAQSMQQNYGYSQPSRTAQLPNFTNTVNPSYGSEVGAKALNAFANMLTGPLEIPKNIINTTNQGNVFYGIFGGGFKGIVNTAGRLAVGLADLVTFPLPTKPVAYPLYVWDDFDVDTTYGDVFRLQERQEVKPPEVQAPPPPVAVPQVAAPAAYPPPPNSQDTNKKLDMMFKKEMMK
ncbi:exosortase system-associated protein, TIGR04073 family [Methylosarcina fibrata]|uniref:exosortase system-associated protein, TIGR04073 family n=1 Tax=Methylosarcina fibrata TaxID=105972 RepID=UPI00036CC561|nr:exosortase system-associated protein, TIGR04073 family [Methylosarcina fibrata]